MRLAGLRQRDAVTCGPAVAVVAGALLDPQCRAALTDSGWFAAEQARVHAHVNRIWPRRLGTTPAAMVRALNVYSRARYRWRVFRGRRDGMADVVRAVATGWPVAMLVGSVIPRHWVLIVGVNGQQLECYEPSSGRLRRVSVADVRHSRLVGLGFGRPFVFVLPARPSS